MFVAVFIGLLLVTGTLGRRPSKLQARLLPEVTAPDNATEVHSFNVSSCPGMSSLTLECLNARHSELQDTNSVPSSRPERA